jgi:integrase/recombinase XerC
MASLFKPTVTTYCLPDGKHRTPDGKRVTKNTPGAVKVSRKSAIWYGKYRGADGIDRREPLCADKTASKQILAKFVIDAKLGEHGLADRYAEHLRRPIAEHLADYGRELRARGNDPRYTSTVVSRLEELLTGCGFVFLPELSASQAMDWLADLRRAGRQRIALEPGKECFTAREVAAVLGIKSLSVGSAVRRHRLEATGKGKARRFPRATVEALQDRLCRGASMATSNQYLSHLKSFCRWLVTDRRRPDNPLVHLEPGNALVDRRHDRRELEAEELRRLLAVTCASNRSFRGFSGADRYALYATACGTGFRASGLASLTVESFTLDADPPTVTLAARRNKSRVLKVQPMPPDLAALLRDYLDGKAAGMPIWGGTWARHGKGAEMLRPDLEAAGIPYEVPGPDGPLFADFHALRHTYLTLGGRAGIDLRTLQELAGHSTPMQTARYSHRRLYDLAGAVEKLPRLLPDTRERRDVEAMPLAATGTHAARHRPRLDQTSALSCDSLRTIETTGEGEPDEGGKRNLLRLQAPEYACEGLIPVDSRVGEGARTLDLQSHSLTL